MRVLVVAPTFHPYIGGGETYTYNKCRRLASAGVEVIVATGPLKNRNFNEYEFTLYEIEGMREVQPDVITASGHTRTLISRVKPDIIHVHDYAGLLIVGLSNEQNIPVVSTIHNTPVWGSRIFGRMDSFDSELTFARKVVELAHPDLITAANEVYADAAKRVVQGSVPVKVLPYPIDAALFIKKSKSSVREDFNLSSSDILLSIPSRVIPRKGIKEAIFALTLLPKNVYLLVPAAAEPFDTVYWNEIVGSEEYRQVEERVLIPKARFTYDDMPSLYTATDIVVMPSYYEGAPLATVEAMTSVKPFVGADSQGINSIIKNESNGLLVPQKDYKSLAAAINRLIEDPLLSNKLVAQAKADVAYLSWDNQLPDILNTYRGITRK